MAFVREVIRCFDLRRINVEGRTAAVHQNRLGSGVYDGMNGGAKCHGRSDHFVAIPDFQGKQCQMDRSSAAAYAHGVGCVFVAGKFLFEALDPSAQPDPIATQTFRDGGDLRFADYRSTENQPAFTRADGFAARDRGNAVGVSCTGWDCPPASGARFIRLVLKILGLTRL